MEFLLFVASIAGVFTLGFVLGVLLHATVSKDVQEIVAEYNKLLAEAKSQLAHIQSVAQNVVGEAKKL